MLLLGDQVHLLLGVELIGQSFQLYLNLKEPMGLLDLKLVLRILEFRLELMVLDWHLIDLKLN